MAQSNYTTEDRLFIIIKAGIMGGIGGSIFLTIVYVLGSINFWQTLIIGFFLFMTSIIITRSFENKINKLTFWVSNLLDRFPKVKRIIHKYF